MALYKDFPLSSHTILDPGIRWFPADEALRETNCLRNMATRLFVFVCASCS